MGRKLFKRAVDVSSTTSLVTLNRNPSTTYTSSPSSPNTTTSSSPTSPTTPITPVSVITLPASPTNLRRISELVDPRDLFDTPFTDDERQAKVYGAPGPPGASTTSSRMLPLQQSPILAESPSGNNFLSAEEYLAQGDRALSMRERREMIATNTRVKVESRGEIRPKATAEQRTELQGKVKARSRFCRFCWC